MQIPTGRPWVIAHRGASRALRENTVPAFREAFARGADAVELDVRRTADGALVVHHDAVVPDVGAIIELERDDLEEAAPWIPDLTDALAACAGMWVNVEIKNSPADPDWDETHGVAALTAAVLSRAGSIDRFLVSSFNPDTLAAAAEAFPGVRTGWIADAVVDPLQAIELAASASHTSVHPHVDTIGGQKANEVVTAATEAGLQVIVWTVDDEDEILRLADAGVHGIITNAPNTARSVLQHRDGDGS